MTPPQGRCTQHYFLLKDSILIEPGGLTFRNNRIFDTQGHQGRANGYLHYRHFKDLEYRFRFDVDNMLVMNTKESPDFPFYGTVYGTGNATIAGNAADGVNIDVAMTTNRNTNFTYMKEGVASAVSNQFIRFVDKTPRRVLQDSIMLMSEYEQAQKEVMEKESDTDIRLNLLIDATPDATMKIIMDPIAGDYISGKGTGNIRTEFYNKGDVKMFGSYRISQEFINSACRKLSARTSSSKTEVPSPLTARRSMPPSTSRQAIL